MSEMRQFLWQAIIEDLAMARNSHKAWKLIGKLDNYTKPMQQHSNITTNQIAHQLLLNFKTPHSTRQLKPNLNTNGCNPNITKPFYLTELKQCINSLKNGKATRLDNIMTEELKHLGHKALVWLLQLINNCLVLMRIPKIWLRSRVVALLKPGKDHTLTKSYPTIPLLSHTFKLMEWLLLNCFPPLSKNASLTIKLDSTLASLPLHSS